MKTSLWPSGSKGVQGVEVVCMEGTWDLTSVSFGFFGFFSLCVLILSLILPIFSRGFYTFLNM